MTRITRLVMKGFKSFANKTEIEFGNKFNCVLGPNGAGKSNVIDAICFVLGKASAKGLRVEKGSNLIYNGGKKKNPAKSAEVSIFFDNKKRIFPEETDEIKITRVIKEKGDSDYLINDKKRTRQQVLELLSIAKINPDGYNIILQGDIIYFVEMSPVEKRQIIEEIAGISVYEDKKQKALNDLSKVEEKINEAELILTERKSFLSELKKERDHAQRYKNLNDNINRNKATLLDNQIADKSKEAEKSNAELSSEKAKLAKIEDNVGSIKSSISESRKKIEDINKEIEEKGEKEQVALHKEIEKIKVDVAVDRQRVDTLTSEITKVEARIEELKLTKKDIQEKIDILFSKNKDVKSEISSKEQDIKKLESRISELNKKHNIDNAQEIESKVEAIEKSAEKLQEELNQLRERQQNLLREKDRLEMKLQGIDEKIKKVRDIEKDNQDSVVRLKNMEKEFKKATLELNQVIAKDGSFVQQLSTAQGKLFSAQEELAKLRIESVQIKTHISGGEAVDKVLGLKKPGVFGTISQLGSVKKEYSLALEVAAGNKIKSIVVEDDAIAAECIKYLKEKRLGIATFLPLNKIKAPPARPDIEQHSKKKGVEGAALSLVSFDARFDKAFRYVFENTLVVSTIDDARRLGIGNLRMVTMSGDLVELSGAMQGGFRDKAKGLGFQEKEIFTKIQEYEAKVADNMAVISRVESEKRENMAIIDRLRELKANLEGEIIKLEKLLHLDSADADVGKEEKARLAKELKDITARLDSAVNEISGKNTQLATLKIEKQTLKDKISSMRNPAVLAEINSFEEKRRELKEDLARLNGDIKNNEAQANNIFAPEMENAEKIIKQHDKEKSAFAKELEALKEKTKKQEALLKEKELAEKKFYSQFKELFNKRSRLNDEISKLEVQIGSKDDEYRQVKLKIDGLSIELARIKAELSAMTEEFKQYEGVELFKEKDIEKIKREIAQFKTMLENFGAVNMRALEIYESAEKEYDSLMQKKDKLKVEREDVLTMINEIDSKKSELFMRTYNVINENFKKVFASLSSKGDASLSLEDPNDPFNGGMNIKVRISGKKFLDIRSLSGGEKTLTALSFIFAVQEHEPASFYVLDEVDAALDKHNSEKLSNLIAAYAERAQYVMISHNDTLISNAENLYGVSMNEDGISKVTSLKI